MSRLTLWAQWLGPTVEPWETAQNMPQSCPNQQARGVWNFLSTTTHHCLKSAFRGIDSQILPVCPASVLPGRGGKENKNPGQGPQVLTVRRVCRIYGQSLGRVSYKRVTCLCGPKRGDSLCFLSNIFDLFYRTSRRTSKVHIAYLESSLSRLVANMLGLQKARQ